MLRHYFASDPNWRSHLVFPIVSGRQKDLDLPLIKKNTPDVRHPNICASKGGSTTAPQRDGAGILYSPMELKKTHA